MRLETIYHFSNSNNNNTSHQHQIRKWFCRFVQNNVSILFITFSIHRPLSSIRHRCRWSQTIRNNPYNFLSLFFFLFIYNLMIFSVLYHFIVGERFFFRSFVLSFSISLISFGVCVCSVGQYNNGMINVFCFRINNNIRGVKMVFNVCSL